MSVTGCTLPIIYIHLVGGRKETFDITVFIGQSEYRKTWFYALRELFNTRNRNTKRRFSCIGQNVKFSKRHIFIHVQSFFLFFLHIYGLRLMIRIPIHAFETHNNPNYMLSKCLTLCIVLTALTKTHDILSWSWPYIVKYNMIRKF